MLKPAPRLAINRQNLVEELSSSGPACDRLTEIDAPGAGRQHAAPLAHQVQPDLRTVSVIALSIAISRVGFKPCFCKRRVMMS
jgi:hypothetical protein